MRPTNYYAYYPDPQRMAAELARHGDLGLADARDYYVDQDFATCNEAIAWCEHHTGAVYRRDDLEDVTPDDLPRGIDWDWEPVIVWDHGHEVAS